LCPESLILLVTVIVWRRNNPSSYTPQELMQQIAADGGVEALQEYINKMGALVLGSSRMACVGFFDAFPCRRCSLPLALCLVRLASRAQRRPLPNTSAACCPPRAAVASCEYNALCCHNRAGVVPRRSSAGMNANVFTPGQLKERQAQLKGQLVRRIIARSFGWCVCVCVRVCVWCVCVAARVAACHIARQSACVAACSACGSFRKERKRAV
jgi:hypothetical protein